MKKELEEDLKTLDILNYELENLKNYLLQNKPSIGKTEDIDFLKQENIVLKQQLLNYREFLNSILENLDDVSKTIAELKNAELKNHE
ncbi:MAG: hypothetical protein FWE18_06060 [Alphaproteobacteria bacterium]|nr:hypothetical protein [Alphaproteobacteria bacterium]